MRARRCPKTFSRPPTPLTRKTLIHRALLAKNIYPRRVCNNKRKCDGLQANVEKKPSFSRMSQGGWKTEMANEGSFPALGRPIIFLPLSPLLMLIAKKHEIFFDLLPERQKVTVATRSPITLSSANSLIKCASQASKYQSKNLYHIWEFAIFPACSVAERQDTQRGQHLIRAAIKVPETIITETSLDTPETRKWSHSYCSSLSPPRPLQFSRNNIVASWKPLKYLVCVATSPVNTGK